MISDSLVCEAQASINDHHILGGGDAEYKSVLIG